MLVAETMTAFMIVAASVNACCVVNNPRSRSFNTLLSTMLMAGAMLDAGTHVFGIPVVLWAVVLIFWGMAGAALHRTHIGSGTASLTALAAPDRSGVVHVHHLLGLIVTAGQLMAHSPHAVTVSIDSITAHPHASLLLPLITVGAAAFVAYSIILVATGDRSRWERGTILSMCAMTMAMGIMVFV